MKRNLNAAVSRILAAGVTLHLLCMLAGSALQLHRAGTVILCLAECFAIVLMGMGLARMVQKGGTSYDDEADFLRR